MGFRGCFIGVDRYANDRIMQLSSAVRDAEALHALFTDNLGQGADLLCDAEATAGAVRATLTRLQTGSEDDIVVIGFSGHGSSTHQLVTHDADPDDLAGFCVSLNELTCLLGDIPARQLVCILDCCFAGGAGAKVLTSARTPRSAGSLASAAAKLEAMAGSGRLILMAAAADEPAWEDGRLGHGLLTYALLEALRGVEGVRRGDRVPIYALLHYVTEQVRSGAATHGARQTATLRGQMDGELTWPVFTPGALYCSRFPERPVARVGTDVQELRQLGFPTPLLDAWGTRIPALNSLQQDAINDFGLLDGSHLLVSAPTSSGKTLLGELVALQAAQRRQRSVFLLPTRALVNDKYDEFTTSYEPLGVRVVRATGEIADDVPALLRGQFDVAILTYEKFTGLLLAAPHLLQLLALVVVDEVQTITDVARGGNLEFLLTLIRSRRAHGIEPQLVLLSAVLGDIGGFDSWLSARYLRRVERPVPLQEGVIRRDGSWRYLDIDGTEHSEQLFLPGYGRGSSQDVLIPLIRHLVGQGQQVLVFRNQRGRTRGCARYLAQALGLPAAADTLAELPDGDPSAASVDLRACLAGGVGFHNAELDRDEKRSLEQGFRQQGSTLRVLVATTTLAQGINTPAEAVIVAELDHPAGAGRSAPYSVAEYKNIIGRAGRLGYSEQGRSFLLVDGPMDEHRKWQHYITGQPEDLHSTLLDPGLDRFTLVLRVLGTITTATGLAPTPGLTADEVAEFLALSFAAHQAFTTGRRFLGQGDAERVLAELVQNGLVTADQAGRLSLSDLGRLAATGLVAARSVLVLAGFFRRLRTTAINRTALVCAAQVTEELEATLMPVNARGWQKECATYGGVLAQQRAGIALDLLLATERVAAAARVKRAVACLLWMDGASRRDLDAALTKHMPSHDAAGYAQAAAARTRDVIDVVLEVARLTHPDADLGELGTALPVQLELGVPQAMAPLARRLGQDLTRSQYLRLHAKGFTGPDAVVAADDDDLLSCLDGDRRQLQRLRRVTSEAAAQDVDMDIATLLAPPA